MDVQEIIDQVDRYHCNLVAVTGGEPLIQKETPVLINQLLDDHYKVLLETNGSQDISIVDPRCVKILDIKGPSSNESGRMDLKNLERLSRRDEIKFVIRDRTDYEYARAILNLAIKANRISNAVHFSPVFGKIPFQMLAQWILEDHLPVRFHLQLHKIIWPSESRRV
jgi:7-carboxy-7-deazaguanine synthase